jgi:hypothetical protein
MGLAAAAAALGTAVAAPAGGDGASLSLAFRNDSLTTGPAPSAPGCIAYVKASPIQALTGQTVGSQAVCITSVQPNSNGGVKQTATGVFTLPGGTLTVAWEGQQAPIDPILSGPWAPPAALVGAQTTFRENLSTGTITGGTGLFAHAKGTVSSSGLTVLGLLGGKAWIANLLAFDLRYRN